MMSSGDPSAPASTSGSRARRPRRDPAGALARRDLDAAGRGLLLFRQNELQYAVALGGANALPIHRRRERQVDEEVQKENTHCRERIYGRFERAFRLPNHVDGDKITADYKDGVLRVEIPKPENVKPKQITVH